MQTKNVEISPAVETKAKPKPLKTVSGKPSAVQARPVVEQPIEVTVAEKPAVKQVKKPTAKAVLVKQAVKAVEAKAAKEEVPRVPAAQQIWGAIKERELGLFGLAGQTVEKYCTPIELDPTRCMLKYKVSSVIPALEAVVPDFDFEVAGAYLVISKKSKK
jgi:hypothetical protein